MSRSSSTFWFLTRGFLACALTLRSAVACSSATPGSSGEKLVEQARPEPPSAVASRTTLDPIGQGGLLWRFQAGAPVLGQAAVSRRGNVFVGTTEGYVHALGPDGTFQWSYTVQGAIVGSLAVGADDTVFVGTSEKRVYALRPDGTLRWVFRSPASVATDILIDRDGIRYGGSETLYRLNSWGQLTEWFSVPGGIAQGPVAVDGQSLLVATRAGEVLAVRSKRALPVGRTARTLGQPPVSAPNGVVAVVDGEELVAFAEAGTEAFRMPGVLSAASGEGGLVAVTRGQELVWLTSSGEVECRVGIQALGCGAGEGAAVSAAPPRAAPDGRVYVSDGSGRLLVVGREGVERCAQVSRMPLTEPVVDAERWRIIVAGRDGSVAALRMSGSGKD